MSFSPYVEPSKHELTWKKGIAIVVVMSLVFVELAFRVVRLPAVDQWVDPVAFELAQAHVEPHPYLAYALKPGWRTPAGTNVQASHNELGFRGQGIEAKKEDDVFRVLCLGSGSTYGIGASNDDATWPARLQYYLHAEEPDRKFEVINMGVEGYSTFENLIDLATRGIDLEPDLVIVYQSLADLRCALYPAPVSDNTHGRSSWTTENSRGLESTLESSYLYKLARRALTDGDVESAGFESQLVVDYEPGTDKFVDAPASTGFDNFERNLTSIVALSRSIGARVLLSSQGLDRVDLTNAPSRGRQLASFERMRAILERVARRQKVEFVDAGKTLEQAARRQWEADGKENVFTWEDGLQDAGADLLASTFAHAIFRGGLLF